MYSKNASYWLVPRRTIGSYGKVVKTATDSLSINLKRLRSERGLTQADVAEGTDVSLRSYQKWEQQESFPDDKNLDKLAKVFRVPVSEFFKVDGVRPRSQPPARSLQDLIKAPDEASHATIALVLQELLIVAPEIRAATLAVLYGDRSIAAPWAQGKKAQGSK